MILSKPYFSCFTHALLKTLSHVLWSCYIQYSDWIFFATSASYPWKISSAVSTVSKLMTH